MPHGITIFSFYRRPPGKSSLLNAVLLEDRALTGPTPGLTRDAVAVEWTWGGRPVRLVDTAGAFARPSVLSFGFTPSLCAGEQSVDGGGGVYAASIS